MKTQATLKSVSKAAFLIASLSLFPGCDLLTNLFKAKKEPKKVAATSTKKMTSQADKSGPVLLNLNSDPVIWESDFNQNLKQMLQANPYFRGAGVDALPMAIKRKFFDELVKQELILSDAKKRKISKKEEFVKAYKDLKRLAKRSLIIQFYEKDIFDTINVSDKEKDEFFEKNKERFIKVPGGVLVSGIKFEDEKDADNFVEQAKKIEEKDFIKDFDVMAKDNDKGTFRGFGRISKQAQGYGFDATPAPVRETALAARNFPAIEKVKVGKEHWVIGIADKKETIFFKRSEVDEQITGIKKNNKFKDQLDERVKALHSDNKVEVNESYFKEKEPADRDDKKETKKTAQSRNTQAPTMAA